MARRGTNSWLAKMLAGKRLPTSWSLSKYNMYFECPTRYALSAIVKFCMLCGSTAGRAGKDQRCKACGKPPLSNPAMTRGEAIHQKGEYYLLGKVRGVPDEFKYFSQELRNLNALGAEPEVSWTLTAGGDTCQWDDWNRAWLRAKIDAHVFDEEDNVLTIVDFKTGRIYPSENQAEVYAWMSPRFYPDLEGVGVEFWYLDQDEVVTVPKKGLFSRKELPGLEKKWRARAVKMLSDKVFAAKPGPQCTRCPFRSSNVIAGRRGPCDAWKAVA